LGEGVRRLPSLVTQMDESLVPQDETTPSITQDALPEVWAAAREAAQTESQRAALASVMLAVPDPLAADYLLDYLQKTPAGSPQTIDFIQHIARHLPAHRAAEVVKLVKSQFANDLAMQWRCLTAVGEALTRSGTPTPPVVKTWAADVVIGGLAQASQQPNFWKPINIAGGDVTPQQFNAWRLEPRPMSLAGDHGPPLRTVTMWSSLPAGETQTGAIASPEFTIPPQLSFVLAGHRGFPDQSPHKLNHISLVLADGEVIASALPPRHDIANKVEWDLTTHQGKLGRVVLHDGDSDTAYAWLAAGDFSAPELAAPRWSPSELTAQLQGWCQLVERFELFEAEPTLQKLVERTDLAPRQRLMVARSLASLRNHAFARNWAEISAQQELPSSTAHWIAHLVGHWDPNWPRESLGLETPTNELPGWPDRGTAGEHQIMLNLMTSSSGRVQREWIKAALSEPDMFDALLTWGERGWLAPASFSGDDVAQATQLSSRPEWTERLNSILADQVGVDQQWLERAQASKTQFSDWLNELKSGRTIQVALPASERSDGESGAQNHLSAWRAHGQQIFKRDCAVCHQIAGEGAIIGPQLDGIHRRGLERVLEDVLLPNQNVDHAFRSQLFLLNDGQVVSGLVQSEDETALIVVDQRGKQQTLPVQDVEERRVSGQSLMPGDVAHQYSDAGLFSLMVYLLEPPTP
jgi:putative heme-binding domain-containing protein